MSQPLDWTLRPLRDVVIFNPRHDRKLPDDLDVSFVPMPAISDRSQNLSAHQTRKLAQVRKGYTHFQDGDVLFAKITPCMENGKAAVARNLVNGIGCGTTELHVLRAESDLLPEWLYFYLWQERFRKEAERNMTGSAGQLRVPLSFLEKQVIPVPPALDEQRRITSKLNHITARLDDTKARLNTIPAILKRFRLSVLAAACSGRLTEDWRKSLAGDDKGDSVTANSDFDLPELPKTWCYENLGAIISSLKYGTSTRCSYEQLGKPVLRIPNIGEDGKINANDLKYGELPDRECRQLALEEGDLLLIRSNGSVSLVGRTALVSGEFQGFAYAGYLIRLRPNKDKVLPAYLNRIMASPYMRLQIEVPARSTSGVNNINSTEVENLLVPLPPIQEQAEIISRVEALFKQADAIDASYRKARTFTDKLMPSVLAKAFRGELTA